MAAGIIQCKMLVQEAKNISLETLVDGLLLALQSGGVGEHEIVIVHANLTSPDIDIMIVPGVSGVANQIVDVWRQRCNKFFEDAPDARVSGKVAVAVVPRGPDGSRVPGGLAAAQNQVSAAVGFKDDPDEDDEEVRLDVPLV